MTLHRRSILIHTTRPAPTGARFRYTLNDIQYWVSAPKRGTAKAWYMGALMVGKGRAPTERWFPCTVAEVATARGDSVNAIVADAKARSLKVAS